jgi:hypothetical protein
VDAIQVVIRDETKKVERLLAAANKTQLAAAGAYLTGIARRMIKTSPEPSAPGHPPHTRKGQLRRAIVFGVERDGHGVVVGPTRNGIGLIGHTHEFGGTEPPKKLRKSRKSWRWYIMQRQVGPLRIVGSKAESGRLTTEAQVARAMRLAAQLPEGLDLYETQTPGLATGITGPRKYPPRPYMGKTLEIGAARLPALWRNSLQGA